MAYKVGIIGYGWAAAAHADAINATTQGEVTAIYSSRPLDDAEVSARHGSEIKTYTNLEEMLASDIDVVSITSYPNQHRDQAVAAAKAGKHLIIEKPLALSWEDCRTIEAAVKEAGVHACVCFEIRYVNQLLTTNHLVSNGFLGDIHYGEVDYYHGIGPWYGQYRWNTTVENGGSSLLSAGCHALDSLLLCMGSEVEEVTSYGTKSKNEIFQKYEYETTTVSMLKFANGSIGKVASVIDCIQPYYFHMHLVGSEGSLLDNKIFSNKLGIQEKNWTELQVALADSGDVSDHPYQAQFQAFFDAVDKNEEMPLTSLREALQSFRVLFACDLSVREGRTVKISELA